MAVSQSSPTETSVDKLGSSPLTPKESTTLPVTAIQNFPICAERNLAPVFGLPFRPSCSVCASGSCTSLGLSGLSFFLRYFLVLLPVWFLGCRPICPWRACHISLYASTLCARLLISSLSFSIHPSVDAGNYPRFPGLMTGNGAAKKVLHKCFQQPISMARFVVQYVDIASKFVYS